MQVRYDQERAAFGTLFLLAYAFQLRLPSEALPAVCGSGEGSLDMQSTIRREGDRMVVQLRRRKNLIFESQVVRTCWCRASPISCPVHCMSEALSTLAHGEELFPGISPSLALKTLRDILTELEVPQAHEYRTQDLRRGHTEDLRASGASLQTILESGNWRSAAFLNYVDGDSLETEAVAQAHGVESSSDEEE